MRKSMRIVAAVLCLAGCHPRYAPLEDGGGGSLGLDSARARVLALIASGEYSHALEYLETVEGFSQVEHDRLEQMISAAERQLVPFLDGAVAHIFRDGSGHFPVDTAEARELIQTTAVEECYVGLKANGTRVYQRILETGAQIWVFVYDGTIRDAGRNDVPRSAERLLK
jgi:hypothetical protein